MLIVVTTQYLENYGDEKNSYWKAKGGSDIIVARLSVREAVELGADGLHRLAMSRIEPHLINHSMAQEYVIDWNLEEDTWVSEDVRLQLEYDGKVTYPTRDLTKEVANAA